MARVTRPGGVVAAAVWDYGDGMEMLRAFWDEAVALDPASEPRDERHRESRHPRTRESRHPRTRESRNPDTRIQTPTNLSVGVISQRVHSPAPSLDAVRARPR
jgi:hypothetical protein